MPDSVKIEEIKALLQKAELEITPTNLLKLAAQISKSLCNADKGLCQLEVDML
jgi:hypothetical protein